METSTNIQSALPGPGTAARVFRPADLKRRARPLEFLVQGFLFFCGVLSIFTTLGIVYVLGRESALFFTNPEVNVVEFFTTFKWLPEIGHFGGWPLVNATLMAGS